MHINYALIETDTIITTNAVTFGHRWSGKLTFKLLFSDPANHLSCTCLVNNNSPLSPVKKLRVQSVTFLNHLVANDTGRGDYIYPYYLPGHG
ncbi:hypothetical protein J6590_041527 [Homalodisca vitripennis]|nr:hypothetical protein J6590_041527 [Homalodisca vitripennis]